MSETAHDQQFIQVVGAGSGEEAKGATISFLVEETDAHTVVRSGGWQAAHNVKMEDGREHMFRHFGSGTFSHARTHLQHMAISPVDLFSESLTLEKLGVREPLSLISIDHNCINVTPFHGAMSRLRELLRGENKKGTIGKGVGEAIRDTKNPALTIRAGDFGRSDESLYKRVDMIRRIKLEEAQRLIHDATITELHPQIFDELKILENEALVEITVKSLSAISRLVHITGSNYFSELLQRNGTIVGEASHGALHHPRDGFLPHVTQIDPTGQDVLSTIHELGYPGKIVRLGVSRSYITRHGAGPLVSYNRYLTQNLQEGTTNSNPLANEWLGEFRNGNFDIVAMNYALAISGGKSTFTGLAISHLDALRGQSQWEICIGYRYEGEKIDMSEFFEMNGETIVGIKVHSDTDRDAHTTHQLRLTQLLKQCKPELITLTPIRGASLENVFLACVEAYVGLPVIATAHGPMSSDRRVRSGYQNLLRTSSL